MSDKVRLTVKQLQFVMELMEELDQELAVEKFVLFMVKERLDPIDMAVLVDKCIPKWERYKEERKKK